MYVYSVGTVSINRFCVGVHCTGSINRFCVGTHSLRAGSGRGRGPGRVPQPRDTAETGAGGNQGHRHADQL